MSDPGMTRPVGWNWIISMSRSVSPARHASAMPSEALSAEPAKIRYIVGPPIEEAAVARLELEDAAGRFGDQRPHQLLIVDEAAALERVEQMRLERIGRSEHGVVAALDHPRAAGAAEQALDDDPDAQAWRRVGGVQRSAEAGAAGAKDQEIEVELIHGSGTDVDVALFLQFHHADDAPLGERLGPGRQLL